MCIILKDAQKKTNKAYVIIKGCLKYLILNMQEDKNIQNYHNLQDKQVVKPNKRCECAKQWMGNETKYTKKENKKYIFIFLFSFFVYFLLKKKVEYTCQERCFKFKGEHSNTGSILNFSAREINDFKP